MNVSLKQVRAFVTLAECRTYAEAADVLHMSQPALSLTIKSLESGIGGTLLKRTTRSFSLTPEGLTFLPQAKSLLSDWDASIESIRNCFLLKSGQVSIAVMPSFAATMLPKALKAYKDAYPNITVALNDVIAEESVDMVRKGKVEIGLSFRPDIMDDLSFEPLFWDEFTVVLPPNHSLAGEQAVLFKDVLSQPLLSLQNPSLVTRLIKNEADRMGLPYFSNMAAHQLATVGRMVSEGLGVSIVPRVCSQQMTEMGTVCRNLRDANIGSEIGILTQKRHALSSAATAFIDVVKDTFAEMDR